MEENYEKAVEYLSMYVNIDLNDTRQRISLTRAIEYADIENYTVSPRNIYESVNNEIFITKASCHFKRKMLNMINDHKQYRDIQEYEWMAVSRLRLRLPPQIKSW